MAKKAGKKAFKDIVDELCSCGCKRSQHNDTLAQGHGSCKACDCKKFMWVKSIYKGGK